MKTINISDVTQNDFRKAKRKGQTMFDKDYTDNQFVKLLLDVFWLRVKEKEG